jgi:hypothetical protein
VQFVHEDTRIQTYRINDEIENGLFDPFLMAQRDSRLCDCEHCNSYFTYPIDEAGKKLRNGFSSWADNYDPNYMAPKFVAQIEKKLVPENLVNIIEAANTNFITMIQTSSQLYKQVQKR